ncbi:MAG TPA: hypothetical protein VF395_02800, partial [Polyangiaceae bacterium]
GTAVAMSAGSVARARKSALDLLPDTSRATRWLLSAAMSAIRLEDLLTTTSFLGTMQTDPDGARGTLRTAIDERVRTAADGPLFRVLWLSLLASLALAVVSVAIVMRNR